MRPTECLRHEHTIVLMMLQGAESTARSTGGTVDIARIEKIIDFSRNFTDRCHHTKEENHLFERLSARGMPKTAGPVAVMLFEHARGRELIKEISGALSEVKGGRSEAVPVLREQLLLYVDLLRSHIMKENNVLFPMSDRVLTDEDQVSLERSFDEVEKMEMGAGVHEKYQEIAMEISGL